LLFALDGFLDAAKPGGFAGELVGNVRQHFADPRLEVANLPVNAVRLDGGGHFEGLGGAFFLEPSLRRELGGAFFLQLFDQSLVGLQHLLLGVLVGQLFDRRGFFWHRMVFGLREGFSGTLSGSRAGGKEKICAAHWFWGEPICGI
jgi:hypothetical protein